MTMDTDLNDVGTNGSHEVLRSQKSVQNARVLIETFRKREEMKLNNTPRFILIFPYFEQILNITYADIYSRWQ